MTGLESPTAAPKKRPRSELEADDATETVNNETIITERDDSTSGDDVGPQLPSAVPKKKRRVLPHEKLYISALPSATRYAKSLMHRDQLSFVTMTPFTDFLTTCSNDGVVKFWKKNVDGVEFVKEFRAHTGEINSVSVSADGRSFATAGVDKTVKIFDVITFDLLSVLTLEYTPIAVCWVHKRGASLPLIAIASESSPIIQIFDGRGESSTPLHIISTLHRSLVHLLAYNPHYDCVVSADTSGMVEYFTPLPPHEKPPTVFLYKSSTSLFEFKKAKSVPTTLTISPTGTHFSTFSLPDRCIRIFLFTTARLHRTYSESLPTLSTAQQASTNPLPALEFGRRLALETSLAPSTSTTSASDVTPIYKTLASKLNIIFDETSNFILYSSLHGIKLINLHTNRLVRVYASTEPSLTRTLHLTLYQGTPSQKSLTTISMAASANPLLQDASARSPMLIATAIAKPRFYIFTNDSTASKSTRDVQNESPHQLHPSSSLSTSTSLASNPTRPTHLTATVAILHTTMGDIHIRLFPAVAPRAIENFVTHAQAGYYNSTLFHRVIRKFMIQGGDPLGDGTGGQSIWGTDFADEFSTLRHDKPYTVSMANAGPNTNASQFFITTEKTPWLDGKHTIFARVVQGMDVVHKIENVRTIKERPDVDVKIVDVEIVS